MHDTSHSAYAHHIARQAVSSRRRSSCTCLEDLREVIHKNKSEHSPLLDLSRLAWTRSTGRLSFAILSATIWERYPSLDFKDHNFKEEDSVLDAESKEMAAFSASGFQTRTIFYGGFCARIRYILGRHSQCVRDSGSHL